MPITQKQREARVKSLGASDAPIVLGVSPYADANVGNLFWQKHVDGLDGLKRDGGGLPDEPKEAKSMGNWIEGALLKWARAQTGIKFSSNQFRRHPNYAELHANCDGIALLQGAECKYVGGTYAGEWGEDGTDKVPVHVFIQCQHQMGVADLECVWVAAAIAGFQLERRLYKVLRDQEMIDHVFGACVMFWQNHVVPRKAPEGWSVPPLAILKERYREPSKTVDVDPALVQAWLVSKETEKCVTATTKAQYAAVVNALGDAEEGVCDSGRVTYMEQVQTRVDTDALKRDGLYKKYSKAGKPFRKLAWKAAKALPEPEKQECLTA